MLCVQLVLTSPRRSIPLTFFWIAMAGTVVSECGARGSAHKANIEVFVERIT